MAKVFPPTPTERLYRAHKRAIALEQAIVRLNHDLAFIGGVPGIDGRPAKDVIVELHKKILKNSITR